MKKKLIPKHQSGNVIKQHNNLYFLDGRLFSIEGFSPNELQAMSNANQGLITEDNRSPQRRFTDNLVGNVKAQLEGKKRVSPYLAYPMAGLAATSIFNPITSLKALGSLATKGAVVDAASNILTGKNYGQAVGDLLDINPEVANFINPAFLPWSKPYNYTVGRFLPKTKIGLKARAKLISQAIDKAPLKYFGSVKYYGPTMGKTTASKDNPDIVDFDAIAREATEKLAAKHGVTKQLLQISPRLEQEYRNMLNRLVEQWRTNPENTNKTLLISKKVLANEPYYDNIPSIPDRATFIQRQIQRGEQYPSRASDYYDALLSANPNLKIENRFVSDMEGNPHYISVEPETKAALLVNQGLNRFINWKTSKSYSQRASINGLTDFHKRNTFVTPAIPINYSQTYELLGVKGATKPDAARMKVYQKDNVWNAITPLSIDIANNTDYTSKIPIHELLHAETGLVRSKDPLIAGTQNGHNVLWGSPEHRYIITQNQDLLPIPKPDANKYTSLPTESRSFLLTDFIHDIFPKLKNANDYNEILLFLRNTDKKTIFTKESLQIINDRLMTDEDIARYLSQALSLTPFIYASTNK